MVWNGTLHDDHLPPLDSLERKLFQNSDQNKQSAHELRIKRSTLLYFLWRDLHVKRPLFYAKVHCYGSSIEGV